MPSLLPQFCCFFLGWCRQVGDASEVVDSVLVLEEIGLLDLIKVGKNCFKFNES